MEVRNPKWLGWALFLLEALGENPFLGLSGSVCVPWLVVPHHSDLCFHHHFPDSPVSHFFPTRILVFMLGLSR